MREHMNRRERGKNKWLRRRRKVEKQKEGCIRRSEEVKKGIGLCTRYSVVSLGWLFEEERMKESRGIWDRADCALSLHSRFDARINTSKAWLRTPLKHRLCSKDRNVYESLLPIKHPCILLRRDCEFQSNKLCGGGATMRSAHVRFHEWTASVMNLFPHVHEDVMGESLKRVTNDEAMNYYYRWTNKDFGKKTEK